MNSSWVSRRPRALVDGPLARGLHVDVGLPEVDVGAADAPREERDLGARHQERLDLPEVAVGRVEARPDRRLETDREAAHVLARDELLAQEADRDERQEEEGEAAYQQPGPVPQGRAERSQVERGQPPEETVHRPAEAAPMLDLEEPRAAHRREGERLEQGEEHGDRDRDAELEEELPDDPLHERDRQEDRDDGERRGGRREGDLARAGRRGLHLAFPHLAVPVDVLEHHDRVVDDDADDESQAEHRVGVQGEAEEVDDGEGPEDRGRDREEDVDGRRPRPEEEPADEARQEGREDEGEEDLVDRALDEDGRVPVDLEPQALRQLGRASTRSSSLTSRPT